jgi:hypothetical protein
MNAQIIAAIISTAGNLAGKVVDFWRGSDNATEENATEEAAVRAVTEHYEDLRDGITDNSMKIIRYLEKEQARNLEEIWREVFGNEPKQEEFSYRLRYLETIGVVRMSPSTVFIEYRITPLGKAFLNEARHRKHYEDVLFD